MNIRPQINAYIAAKILPLYEHFDKGHGSGHARTVLRNSLEIVEEIAVEVDREMVYVIAAYHDIGLKFGRENHEKNSAIELLRDEKLREWFTAEQLATMAEAVEDHRASNSREPRSIYGKIVSEADRDIDYLTILTRTAQYSTANFPELSPEQHFARSMEHFRAKYARGGYLRLWLETRRNREKLNEMQEILDDEERVREDFLRILTENA